MVSDSVVYNFQVTSPVAFKNKFYVKLLLHHPVSYKMINETP